MKSFYGYLLFFMVCTVAGYGQKPALDAGCYKHWADVSNGQYVVYRENDTPEGSGRLVIRSVEGDWK